RVRGLATLGIAFSMFGAFRLAQRRVAEASAIAQRSGNPASLSFAAFGRGFLQFFTGPLTECYDTFQDTAATFYGIGDIRAWGSAVLQQNWITYWQADFPKTERMTVELVRVGEGAGDPHVQVFGLAVAGVLKLTTGPLDEAAADCSKMLDLSIQITPHRTQQEAGATLAPTLLPQ